MRRRSQDTRTLVYFYLVASSRSYRHAAEQLAISVSALSRPIQELERELGALLFVRGGRHETQLTQAGQSFLGDTEKVLESLLQIGSWAKQQKHKGAGTKAARSDATDDTAS